MGIPSSWVDVVEQHLSFLILIQNLAFCTPVTCKPKIRLEARIGEGMVSATFVFFMLTFWISVNLFFLCYLNWGYVYCRGHYFSWTGFSNLSNEFREDFVATFHTSPCVVRILVLTTNPITQFSHRDACHDSNRSTAHSTPMINEWLLLHNRTKCRWSYEGRISP